MKRLFIILLSLALIAALLAGCAPKAAALPDGTFEGEAKGYGGPLKVSVTVAGGKIAGVAVLSNSETAEYGGRAIEALPGNIAAANSLGIDAISGATITSRAIFRAAADAITRAGGDPAAYGYVAEEDISAADVVTIVGLPDGKTAEITGEQLMAFAPVEITATSVNSAGETNDVSAKGVYLETVLATLGVSQADYAGIVFTATDGYSIEVPKSVLEIRDILIAYEVNGEPCSPRTIVPEERAMYWVKFLGTIELLEHIEVVPVDTLFVLETMTAALAGEDYKYYDSVDQAVPVADIFTAYLTAQPDFVTLISVDGLNKYDKYDTVAAQFIKITGEDAPLFIGPNLPEGMRLKHTLLIKLDNEAVVSVVSAMVKDGLTESVPLTALLEIAGILDAETYKLAGGDGYAVDIAKADLEKGVVTIEDGVVVVRFAGLEKNTTVKGLLRIEAVS